MAKAPSPTFLVDRSLGRKLIVDALRSHGYLVVAHDEHFPQSTEDSVWLREAGRRGWAVLTKDSAIRRNPLERSAYRDAGVRVFVLTSQNLTGADMAAIFLSAMPVICARCDDTEAPCLFGVYRDGSVRSLS